MRRCHEERSLSRTSSFRSCCTLEKTQTVFSLACTRTSRCRQALPPGVHLPLTRTMKPMSEIESEIRQPRQKRSQEAYARVLQAGRDILERQGLSGFTVQAVSQQAGVSVGSIYLRAPSRKALLLAIHAEEMER